MSDPIPSATADPSTVDQTTPANAEDRKAAAALSSLHTNEISSGASSGKTNNINQEALGKAMSRLEISGQDTSKKGTGHAQKVDGVAKKQVVKVAPADVALLVDQLELTKMKATELLKAHDGDAVKAMTAFISPSIRT
ncbi:uncharacterized protein N7511_010483 [Penicillium nucicola]|uniref:uncharacterized protein n=1 Tax=Penicillium nucicola TaxID=1850975 RepID=UPI002544D311|nr:uncharacterized protein N7511_010483 [Penicillium nucicola]KAJ5748787.1 hypothetical protein N7511_010483 [Penicillium nucicola]